MNYYKFHKKKLMDGGLLLEDKHRKKFLEIESTLSKVATYWESKILSR